MNPLNEATTAVLNVENRLLVNLGNLRVTSFYGFRNIRQLPGFFCQSDLKTEKIFNGRSYRGEFVRFDMFSMIVFFCAGSVLKAIALTTVEISVEN